MTEHHVFRYIQQLAMAQLCLCINCVPYFWPWSGHRPFGEGLAASSFNLLSQIIPCLDMAMLMRFNFSLGQAAALPRMASIH
jgi:hypothetical protein